VLPTRASTSGSAELLASRGMTAVLQEIKRDYPSHTIILDLPPLLSSDDAIAVLPQVDCVMLVTAVGTTTVAQIEECSKHLLSADVVRVVLNKVPEQNTKEYCYY
jgi:Mrp family chromosome partitioning ATPase